MRRGFVSTVQVHSGVGAPAHVRRIGNIRRAAVQPSTAMVVAKDANYNNIAFFEHLFLGVRQWC